MAKCHYIEQYVITTFICSSVYYFLEELLNITFPSGTDKTIHVIREVYTVIINKVLHRRRFGYLKLNCFIVRLTVLFDYTSRIICVIFK